MQHWQWCKLWALRMVKVPNRCSSLKVPLASTNANNSLKVLQISGHCLPVMCTKAASAANFNVLPFKMRNHANSGHCTQLREQQSTKYYQLQLSTLSVFIVWSVFHWKPKVKINLALVSTEQKNLLGLLLQTGPHWLRRNRHIWKSYK